MKKGIVFIALATNCFASAAGAKTTLEWWQFWTDPSIKPTIARMVDQFEQQHPDIAIKVVDLTWANGHEKIAIAFASGRAPDIVELGSDWIAQFAANGHLAAWTESMLGDSGQYQGWGMATYHDTVWAKPWILGTRVLFGNRDLIMRAGYDSTWVPFRITQLLTAANRITRLGDGIYGWGSNTAEKHRLYKKFLPFFWTYNAQVLTDDGRLCVLPSEQAVHALTMYRAFHDTSGYVADQRGIEDAFLDGKIGFILSGDWLLKRIELEDRKINLLSTIFPGLNFTGMSFMGGEFLAISSGCDEKEAAAAFVDYITSPENQVRFCKANRSANPSSIVAQKDDYFQSSEHLQTFIKQIQSAKHPPVDPNWVYMEDAIEGAVEATLFEGELPGEALRKARLRIVEVRGQ